MSDVFQRTGNLLAAAEAGSVGLSAAMAFLFGPRTFCTPPTNRVLVPAGAWMMPCAS